MNRLVATLSILSLSGCGERAPSDVVQPTSAPNALTATPTPSPKPHASPPPLAAQPLTGDFSVSSTTAMGVTGNLTITPGRFEFDYQDYAVGAPTQVEAKSASPTGESWSEVLIAPESARVLIWPVTRVEVDKEAPNGDLCGRRTTRFLVTGTPSKFGEDDLQIAAFSNVKPVERIAETELCGTFNYMADDAKSKP